MMWESYSHIAFQVRDMDAILAFYCDILGMKKKFVLTTDDIVDYATEQAAAGEIPSDEAKAHIEAAKAVAGRPLIVYVEMAPRQFIEFFYCYETLDTPKPLAQCYGYQHLALETKDIEAVYAELTHKGIVPDTPINQGPDYTKQFWIHDPEGNRIEIMEYTDRSFQICR